MLLIQAQGNAVDSYLLFFIFITVLRPSNLYSLSFLPFLTILCRFKFPHYSFIVGQKKAHSILFSDFILF